MIKSPQTSPSHLLSLMYVIDQKKEDDLLDRDYSKSHIWDEYFSKNLSLEKIKYLKSQDFSTSGRSFSKESLVLSFDRDKPLDVWESALEAKLKHQQVWMRGWVNPKDSDWQKIWLRCNNLGISWMLDEVVESSTMWDVLIESWIEPVWSIQRIWPLNEWVCRFWQKKSGFSPSPLFSPLLTKAPKKWNSFEHHFIESYIQRWSEEELMNMFSALKNYTA